MYFKWKAVIPGRGRELDHRRKAFYANHAWDDLNGLERVSNGLEEWGVPASPRAPPPPPPGRAAKGGISGVAWVAARSERLVRLM